MDQHGKIVHISGDPEVPYYSVWIIIPLKGVDVFKQNKLRGHHFDQDPNKVHTLLFLSQQQIRAFSRHGSGCGRLDLGTVSTFVPGFRYGKHLWSEVEDEDDFPYGDSDRDHVHTLPGIPRIASGSHFSKFGFG